MLDFQRLKEVVESLLFVTKKPLTEEELAKLTDADIDSVKTAIQELSDKYENQSGIKLIKLAHGNIMGTSPENAEYVDRLVNSKIETTLSPQSLETLAIIAYKQPITKQDLEKIRGVYCDGVIDTLVNKKLVEEKGRSNALGRPILYGTAIEFLRHFGLKDLTELPMLPNNGEAQQELFKTALHE